MSTEGINSCGQARLSVEDLKGMNTYAALDIFQPQLVTDVTQNLVPFLGSGFDCGE
jgi:hypothetical protein